MPCAQHDDPTQIRPCLVEEMVLNPAALPGSMQGWRCFRIEYGHECSCPEGTYLAAPKRTSDAIEAFLPAFPIFRDHSCSEMC